MGTEVFMICSLTYNKLKDKMELSSPMEIFSSSSELKQWISSYIFSYNIKIGLVLSGIGIFSYFIAKNCYRDYKYILAQRKEEKLRTRLIKGDKLSMEKMTCVICMNNVRSVVFLPCKHVAACLACYENMPAQHKKKCCICKSESKGIAKLFIS